MTNFLKKELVMFNIVVELPGVFDVYAINTAMEFALRNSDTEKYRWSIDFSVEHNRNGFKYALDQGDNSLLKPALSSCFSWRFIIKPSRTVFFFRRFFSSNHNKYRLKIRLDNLIENMRYSYLIFQIDAKYILEGADWLKNDE
jgi:hypothetical protein